MFYSRHSEMNSIDIVFETRTLVMFIHLMFRSLSFAMRSGQASKALHLNPQRLRMIEHPVVLII